MIAIMLAVSLAWMFAASIFGTLLGKALKVLEDADKDGVRYTEEQLNAMFEAWSDLGDEVLAIEADEEMTDEEKDAATQLAVNTMNLRHPHHKERCQCKRYGILEGKSVLDTFGLHGPFVCQPEREVCWEDHH